jgi:predicted ATPase/serine/threonine protein kinase/DNA-binding CsgD family transcriptional regulator
MNWDEGSFSPELTLPSLLLPHPSRVHDVFSCVIKHASARHHIAPLHRLDVIHFCETKEQGERDVQLHRGGVKMTDRVGQHLGHYQLIQLLGQGHWASVYLGEHRHLHTQAAIKVLHGPWADREVDGFLGEARTLALLRHPHIVRVLDFGVQEGTPFLVLEYAPGGTLRQRHPKGTRLPLQTVVSYVKQVASALHYAHEQRLIHRDLKPENLLLGPDQELWLSDFGLAILAHSARSQSFQQTAGTLAYMAPEQLEGHPTPASDQYALGVLVYEWLAGERPFSGSVTELAVKQALAPPPSLSEKVPTLPSTVEQVVLQALAKDHAQRFPSVQAFALALEEASREDASRQTLPFLASGDPAEAGRRAASMDHLPRGTVTLLFSDMEGSTSLLQQLGERYTQVLGECRRLLRAAFHRWHGHEVDTQGDSFFVAFARATDALDAAVDAQRALARHTWPEGMSVRVRMGVHTGEPQLSAEGYVGLDVHRAARIMSAGHGGQVLLSQTTRDLVEHDPPQGVSLRDLGAHRLKDLQQKSHLFQLVIEGLPADFPPLKTLDTHPNNLPGQPTPFIGREQEVEACEQLLRRQEVRLLTLTGPGGIGKTRLALQVAADLSKVFPEGLYFVNLAPVRDPGFVVPTIAQALDVKELAGQPVLDLLKAFLGEKQLLLLLDNFEQVVNAAIQVAELLAACPQLKVLVTSRMVLHVQAEHEFAVPSLSVPDPRHLPEVVELARYEALALFIQRAQAARPEFQLSNANARAITEICRHLDGLPLAIELAAARVKLLPPQALLARLTPRLTVLTSGARDVPERQQTLRNTIAWSYQLLDAEVQRLFRRLSVFIGGCTLRAIEAIAAALDGEAGRVFEGVASLLDQSLLQQTEQEGEEPRLVMLETIREYGLEVLEASGERETTQRAHAAYYLALAEEAEPELAGPRQAMWLERLEREHDNLRAAMQWLFGQEGTEQGREMALRLGGALLRFWEVRGHWSEGWNFLEWARAESEGVAVPAQVKVLMAAAYLLDHLENDTDRAQALYEESLVLYRALGDTAGIALSLSQLGEIAGRRGNFAVAYTRTEEALALFREVGDKQGIAWSLINLAGIVSQQGEYVRAISLNKESLTLFREVGDKQGIAWSLINLAGIVSQQGEYARAISLNEESLALCREVGDVEGIVWSLFGLARVLFLSQGDSVRVHTLLEEGLALCREVGHKLGIAWALGHLGEVFLQQGNAIKARSRLQESLPLYREGRDQRGIAESLSLLGRVEALAGDYVAARACSEESLAIGREVGDNLSIGFSLEGLAAVVAVQGDPAWAARLWGAAASLREAMGTPIPPVYRTDYDRSVAAARAQLGEKAFAAAWAQGRMMTPEQALAAQTPSATSMPARPTATPSMKSPPYPAGLSAREVEVLRLVAQGLTNEQVAQQLVISPRTVDTHLTSIYSKIGVSSRSAATRFAMEHHLA